MRGGRASTGSARAGLENFSTGTLSLSLSKAAHSLGLTLALAACSSNAPAPEAPEGAEGVEHVACALGGDQTFKPDCAVERAQAEGKLVLIVRHPDGAFRRFAVLGGGQGLALADGAEMAQVAMVGKDLEVTVGLDRYRFPATAKGNAAKP